jgi:hypothetical protein
MIEEVLHGHLENSEVRTRSFINHRGNAELEAQGSGSFTATALCRYAPLVDDIQGEWYKRQFDGMVYYLVMKIVTLTVEPVSVGDLTAWKVTGRFSWST